MNFREWPPKRRILLLSVGWIFAVLVVLVWLLARMASVAADQGQRSFHGREELPAEPGLSFLVPATRFFQILLRRTAEHEPYDSGQSSAFTSSQVCSSSGCFSISARRSSRICFCQPGIVRKPTSSSGSMLSQSI